MSQIRDLVWKMLRMESHNLGPYGMTRQQAFVLSALPDTGAGQPVQDPVGLLAVISGLLALAAALAGTYQARRER